MDRCYGTCDYWIFILVLCRAAHTGTRKYTIQKNTWKATIRLELSKMTTLNLDGTFSMYGVIYSG